MAVGIYFRRERPINTSENNWLYGIDTCCCFNIKVHFPLSVNLQRAKFPKIVSMVYGSCDY